MFSFEQAITEFDRYPLSNDRFMLRRLGNMLGKDVSQNRTFSESSNFGMNRIQLLDRLGRPPKPNNGRSIAQNCIPFLPTSISAGRTRQNNFVCKTLTPDRRSQDKENINSKNIPGFLDHSMTCTETSTNRSKHRFIIKKSSPAGNNKTDKSLTVAADKSNIFKRQPSIKFKSLVDCSRSLTNDNQLSTLLQDLPKITSRSWVAFDARSRESLVGYKYGVKREVASLTKLMTLFTACKLIDESRLTPRNFEVTVTCNAASRIGTSANLMTGDRLSLYDLLFGI